jgi:hypothetical protein
MNGFDDFMTVSHSNPVPKGTENLLGGQISTDMLSLRDRIYSNFGITSYLLTILDAFLLHNSIPREDKIVLAATIDRVSRFPVTLVSGEKLRTVMFKINTNTFCSRHL